MTNEEGKSLTLIDSHNAADVLFSARAYMWAKVTQLLDRDNELCTNWGENALIAYLVDLGKGNRAVTLVRFFPQG